MLWLWVIIVQHVTIDDVIVPILGGKGTIYFVRTCNILLYSPNIIPFQIIFPQIIHFQLTIFSLSMKCSKQYWVPIFFETFTSFSLSQFFIDHNLFTFWSLFAFHHFHHGESLSQSLLWFYLLQFPLSIATLQFIAWSTLFCSPTINCIVCHYAQRSSRWSYGLIDGNPWIPEQHS